MRPGVLRFIRLMTAGIVAGSACVSATAASAADWWELNFWMSGPRYDSKVPLCDEHGPLDKIRTRSGAKEGDFWNSAIEIVAFEHIREVAWEPWMSGTIPRRFCAAQVILNDSTRRPIYYSIAEDTGMLGFGYGVEWCVTGLDRNWAYNPRCRLARP
jgi:hypothetical protein